MDYTQLAKEIRQEIHGTQARLADLRKAHRAIHNLNGGGNHTNGNGAGRVLSAKARKAIGDAQRARWAKQKREERRAAR